jgi:hypothetical protein
MKPGSLKLQPVLSSSTTKLQQAKAISKKQIIGLNTKGRVLMLDLNEKIPSWKEFGPTLKFKSISCGEKRRFGRFSQLWAISFDDKPYQYDKKSNTWLPSADRLLNASVAHDNSVYGIRKFDSKLVKWDNKHYWTPQHKTIDRCWSIQGK